MNSWKWIIGKKHSKKLWANQYCRSLWLEAAWAPMEIWVKSSWKVLCTHVDKQILSSWHHRKKPMKWCGVGHCTSSSFGNFQTFCFQIYSRKKKFLFYSVDCCCRKLFHVQLHVAKKQKNSQYNNNCDAMQVAKSFTIFLLRLLYDCKSNLIKIYEISRVESCKVYRKRIQFRRIENFSKNPTWWTLGETSLSSEKCTKQ